MLHKLKLQQFYSILPACFCLCVILIDWLVTRVVNTYGPQTRGGGGQGESGEKQRGPRDCGNAAIEERLLNIETHLKLPTGQ